MVKNIFFIHRFHFNQSYYDSDDFQYFKEKGYNVKYLDLVKMLKSSKLEDTCPPKLKEDVIYINTKSEFKNFLIEHKYNSLLLTCVGLQVNSAWFYRIISKTGMPYVFLDVNFFPKLNSRNKIKSLSTRIKRYFEKISPIYLALKLFKSFDYYYTRTILKPALAVLHVKKTIRKRIIKICDDSTKFVRTNSKDWNTAISATNESIKDDNYLVFIDQYIPYHPDFVSRGIDLKFTPEEYYAELNSFLSEISRKTGLKVHVAAHPRRVGQRDYDFPVSYNITASLVKYSKLVLAHYSTAVNFAAIHNKPLVFLTSDLFKRSYIGTNISDMAHTFSKEPFNISKGMENLDLDELLAVDEDVYSKYIQENLAPAESNSSSVGALVMDIIKSWSGLNQEPDKRKLKKAV